MDFALLLLKLEEASGMKVVGVDGEHVGPSFECDTGLENTSKFIRYATYSQTSTYHKAQLCCHAFLDSAYDGGPGASQYYFPLLHLANTTSSSHGVRCSNVQYFSFWVLDSSVPENLHCHNNHLATVSPAPRPRV